MPTHPSRTPAPAPSAPPSRACSLRHRPANAGTPARLSGSPASPPRQASIGGFGVTPPCAQLSTAELLGRSPWYSSGLGTLLLSIGDALPGARGATMGRPPAPLPASPGRPCVPPGPSLSGGGACHALAMAHVCVNVHGPAPCARPHAHQVVRYRVQQAVRRPSARSGTGDQPSASEPRRCSPHPRTRGQSMGSPPEVRTTDTIPRSHHPTTPVHGQMSHGRTSSPPAF